MNEHENLVLKACLTLLINQTTSSIVNLNKQFNCEISMKISPEEVSVKVDGEEIKTDEW